MTHSHRVSLEHILEQNESIRDVCKLHRKLLQALNIKQQNLLQPASHPKKNCVLMFVHNILNPEWIAVHCNAKMLDMVLCQVDQVDQQENFTNLYVTESHFCENRWLLLSQKCLLFYQSHTKNTRNQNTKQQQLCEVQKRESNSCLQVLNWYVHPIKNHSILSVYDINRPVSNLKCKTKKASNIKTLEKLKHMVKCNDGTYMSMFHDEELQVDCLQMNPNAVQPACILQGKMTHNVTFCTKICQPSDCKCSPLYMQSTCGGCKPYDLDQKTFKALSKTVGSFRSEKYVCSDINCSDEGMIPPEFINDLVPDNMNQEDELELKIISINPQRMSLWNCPHYTMFACYPGHSHCYAFHKHCMYELHPVYSTLLHCRTGEHLRTCSHFNCSVAFKCPASYCIPWKYVCDGKWDCPTVTDEIQCNNQTCISMFKCKQSSTCLHLKEICDKSYDCPMRDDEIYCDLSQECPNKCICVNYAMYCQNSTELKASDFISYVFLHIEKSKINFLSLYSFVMDARILKLVYTRITHVCSQATNNSQKLELLDVSQNFVGQLTSACFVTNKQLKILKLSANNI